MEPLLIHPFGLTAFPPHPLHSICQPLDMPLLWFSLLIPDSGPGGDEVTSSGLPHVPAPLLALLSHLQLD